MDQAIFLSSKLIKDLTELEDKVVKQLKCGEDIIRIKRDNSKLYMKYIFMHINSDLYEMKIDIDINKCIICKAEAFGLGGRTIYDNVQMNMNDELNRIVSIMKEGD